MTTKITTTPTPLAVVDKINSIIDDKLDKTGTAASATTLTGLTATVAELNKMDGVTATASEINKLDGLTATTTELNYVDGVTSNIQTQLNGKLGSTAQAADSAKLGGTAASSYAKLASPTFTGTVTAPTLTVSTTLNIPGGKIWIA